MIYAVSQFAYIVASVCFIFALHWMNTPATARKGVYAGVAGDGHRGDRHVGGSSSDSPRVDRPGNRGRLCRRRSAVESAADRRSAAHRRLSHAFGGLAAGLVGTAEYYLQLSEAPESLTTFRMIALIAEVILGVPHVHGQPHGGRQASGGAWIPQRPVTYPLQNVGNFVLLGFALLVAVALTTHPPPVGP